MTDSHPLPDRIRPMSLDEFVGQQHLVGEGMPLYQAIKNRAVQSMIFWGPPGVGKTTLARIVANAMDRPFYGLSAVSAGKADIAAIVNTVKKPEPGAQRSLFSNDDERPTGAVLFLDEIHRFNKAQQDFLLPYVEDGTLTLIGATTENPSFEVISALLSRMQVYILNSLSEDELTLIIGRGIDELDIDITDEAVAFLANYANGDARQALNLLHASSRLYGNNGEQITIEKLKNTLQSKFLRYDKQADEHYDTISAFIKSMRASDVDAALYYLARMVAAGEDPKFIARRMVIFASEDVGMALPTALVVANAVFRAVETIGYPECQINLAHGTAYLALAAKSRASCDAFFAALDDVQRTGNLPIPMHLRNAPTQLMKELGYGKGDGGQGNLPEALRSRRYYPAQED